MVSIADTHADCGYGATVLVADDTAVTREIVKNILHTAGYQTLDVGDGAAALDLMRQASVDALITDLEMPNIPGKELVARLRSGEIPGFRTIPIIVISSQNDPVTRNELRSLGANAFVPKPLSSQRLNRTLHQVL